MKRLPVIFFQIFFVLAIVSISGCGSNSGIKNKDFSNRKIKVVATTGMIGDIARNIGLDRVEVTTLMGPGVDPHLYKASEGNVRVMTEADIIFYNGLHLEGKLSEILENIERLGVYTLAAGGNIPEEKLISHNGAHDPHVWFDVGIWKYAAEAIGNKYAEIDSANADYYQVNTESYLTILDELDKYIRVRVAEVPENNRVLVTAHDAFSYFGKAYGFEVLGLQGISTATEAGTADVQGLAQFIADRRIPAIFVESSIPVRTLEAVKAAVKAKHFNVEIGGELFSDAMGNPGTPEGEYVGMVKHNIDTIVEALK